MIKSKEFRLSPSSIKSFIASKAKWAGTYILGIKEEYENDSLLLGKLFESRLCTGEDDRSITEGQIISNKEKLIESYDNLKFNASEFKFQKGELQVEVKGELFGEPILGYIDNKLEDCIEDIKTTQYVSKDDGVKNFWSGMSYWDEYKLQLWIYYKLTGIQKTRILEFGKFKYKDKRKNMQVIEFVFDDKLDQEMENKYKPIIKEMRELYQKFAIV